MQLMEQHHALAECPEIMGCAQLIASCCTQFRRSGGCAHLMAQHHIVTGCTQCQRLGCVRSYWNSIAL